MDVRKVRVRLYSGIPEGESSMPTCGVCNVQIKRDEGYAGVLYDTGSSSTREVRHRTECVDWSATEASNLEVGDLLWSHRFKLTDWGPRIKVRVVHLNWEDTNHLGWGAVWLEPANGSDPEPLDKLRAIGEHWAIQLADEIGSVDPLPSRVYVPREELVHLKRETPQV